MSSEIDLTEFIDGGNGISTVRTSRVFGGDNFRGWNGIKYKAGLSAKNTGAARLSMNVATVAPGAIAYAHIHDGFELMLYIMQGKVRHIYGENLEHTIDNEAGDFIYIEPGIPHEVYNLSELEPVVAVVARSDASEWENIIPHPSEARTRDNVQE
ncbi:MAG: cupin domain-containing protein [Planctomycetota bacterium]